MTEVQRLTHELKSLGLSPAHVAHCRISFKELRPTYHNEEHCYSTALTFLALARRAGLGGESQRIGLLFVVSHHFIFSE